MNDDDFEIRVSIEAQLVFKEPPLSATTTQVRELANLRVREMAKLFESGVKTILEELASRYEPM